MKQAKITVNGKVQGVNFRTNVKNKADNLNLLGTVINLPTGNQVEITIEGHEEEIEKLINWIETDSHYARIEKVEVEWTTPEGKYKSFEIVD